MAADERDDQPGSARRDLRRGLWLSAGSILWTLSVSAAEVALGVTHHVLSLTVFGLAGLLDAAGSATLVAHFRHTLRHDRISEAHERRAMLVVSAGLLVLGSLTVAESIRRLVEGHAAQATGAGTAIAAASVAVLAGLAIMKQRVGRAVGTHALVADGWLSASGALLAVLAVVGATFGARPHRAFIDPVAALVIGVLVGVYGAILLRSVIPPAGR